MMGSLTTNPREHNRHGSPHAQLRSYLGTVVRVYTQKPDKLNGGVAWEKHEIILVDVKICDAKDWKSHLGSSR